MITFLTLMGGTMCPQFFQMEISPRKKYRYGDGGLKFFDISNSLLTFKKSDSLTFTAVFLVIKKVRVRAQNASENGSKGSLIEN